MTPLQDCRLRLIEQRQRVLELEQENHKLKAQISQERELHLSQMVRLQNSMSSVRTMMAFRGLLEEPVLQPLPKRKPALWRRAVRRTVDTIRGES